MTDTLPLPPVDEMPVLANMTDAMKLDLAVSDEDKIYIFHDKPFQERVNWVEYDMDTKQIFCITEKGRIQGLGLNVKKNMQEQIIKATCIFVVYVDKGETKEILEMPIIFHSTGFGHKK